MSLILDALRKMELERKAKRLSSQEVRADVLNYRGNLHAPARNRLVPVIVALVGFFSAVGLFFYFQGYSAKPVASVPVAAPPAVAPPAQQSVPPALPPHAPQQAAKPEVLNRPFTGGAAKGKTDEMPLLPDDNTMAIAGIAWQEERSLRRAVINGSLVSEGAEIGGAKVVEIRQNLVRFSRDGRTFDVIYTSGSVR